MSMLHIKTISKKNLHPVSVVLVQSIGEIIPIAISLKLHSTQVYRTVRSGNKSNQMLFDMSSGSHDCLHKHFNAVVVFDATYI